MIIIRPSCEQDLSAITAIYAHYVRHSTCTFELDAPAEAEMARRRQEVLSKNIPFLVAQTPAGQVIGYAYGNWFKPREAYRFCIENSIYLAPEATGKGIGRMLLAEFSAQAERQGIRKLVAVIGGSDNHASIKLHQAHGFRQAGLLSACGWKFEQWIDVVLMEKSLGCGANKAP